MRSTTSAAISFFPPGKWNVTEPRGAFDSLTMSLIAVPAYPWRRISSRDDRMTRSRVSVRGMTASSPSWFIEDPKSLARTTNTISPVPPTSRRHDYIP
jgi:hypothetical protein